MRRGDCPHHCLRLLETVLEHSTDRPFRSHEFVETPLAVHYSMVGRTRVVLRQTEGYKYTRIPCIAKKGDPFDSLYLMTLPHNAWDGFIWGFEATLLVDERFPKGHTPRENARSVLGPEKRIHSRGTAANAWLRETELAAKSAQQYFCSS